ncbi:hypothetical protein H1C71_018251 [Ictidomys tridecemlineatus]|nr:hypothetical protein H1C71_018251 [Ictidomys tridecemlineatus]
MTSSKSNSSLLVHLLIEFRFHVTLPGVQLISQIPATKPLFGFCHCVMESGGGRCPDMTSEQAHTRSACVIPSSSLRLQTNSFNHLSQKLFMNQQQTHRLVVWQPLSSVEV